MSFNKICWKHVIKRICHERSYIYPTVFLIKRLSLKVYTIKITNFISGFIIWEAIDEFEAQFLTKGTVVLFIHMDNAQEYKHKQYGKWKRDIFVPINIAWILVRKSWQMSGTKKINTATVMNLINHFRTGQKIFFMWGTCI